MNYRKLMETLKKALDEEIYDGHIDKAELSSEVFDALYPIAEDDEEGCVIYSEGFKDLVEQLKAQTPEDEENELLSKIIEEIGPSNYEMLLEGSINYLIIHFTNDSQEDDIEEDPKQVEDEEVLEESLNEIAMERYLSVEPEGLVLYQGDTVEDILDKFPYVDGMTDDDVRKAAKKCFSNITDDIRVQWY